MYFEYAKHEPEKVYFGNLNIGDVFRYNDMVYIKLKGYGALSIYDDIIGDIKIDYNEKVELLNYKIMIYGEE